MKIEATLAAWTSGAATASNAATPQWQDALQRALGQALAVEAGAGHPLASPAPDPDRDRSPAAAQLPGMPLPPRLPFSGPTAPSAAQPRTLPEALQAPAWPPFASQASLRGQQVSASLRDARIDDVEAQAIRRHLSRQLGRAGLELADLRINGHDITDRS